MFCRAHGQRTDVRVRQEVRNTPERDEQLGSAQRLRARHHGTDHVRPERGQSPAAVAPPESRPKSVYTHHIITWRALKNFNKKLKKKKKPSRHGIRTGKMS